ncbi:ribonuclease BN [Halosegnis sp.]|uniref:DUF7139 domain-containing protein n=1 Tax=Halosegnis sp. TaxID=2864959 RepID=UPI0035D4EA0C
MTSLADVYEGGAGGADRRRLYAGVGLFAVGAALTVVGILVGTSAGATGVLGLGKFGARELAGVLAGVGLPATFLGAMTVLPRASWRIRAAGWLGAAVALAGVVAFVAVYPGQWFGMTPDYTLPVTALYFVGAITTFWCLFVAVANFKARNDPGGTVRLEVTKAGRTKVVEVSNERLRQGLGGIGLLGDGPDGEAATQTNRDRPATGTAASDGGAEVMETGGGSATQSEPAGPDTVSTRPTRTQDHPTGHDRGQSDPVPTGDDAYCGNCAKFRYVRTDEGLQPYCGLYDEPMDDMEACDQWLPNTD